MVGSGLSDLRPLSSFTPRISGQVRMQAEAALVSHGYMVVHWALMLCLVRLQFCLCSAYPLAHPCLGPSRTGTFTSWMGRRTTPVLWMQRET